MANQTDDEQVIEARTTKAVDFYGDQITAAQGEDEEIYVPLRPLTDFLGLDRTAQQRRVQRDPVLSKRLRTVRMDTGGGLQRVLCLPLDLLPGWLFGITTGKMSEAMADKLNRYREQCFRVLWNAFKGDVVSATQRPASLSRAEETLALVDAMREMALQQVEFEQELTRLDNAQQVTEQKREIMANWMRGFVQDTRTKLGEFEVRVSSLEMKVDPRSQVTEAEAAEIALAVKNVAYALEQRSGASSYGRVYSELYRRFDVRSYRVIPRNKYQQVLDWLRGWYDEVIGKEQGAASE